MKTSWGILVFCTEMKARHPLPQFYMRLKHRPQATGLRRLSLKFPVTKISGARLIVIYMDYLCKTCCNGYLHIPTEVQVVMTLEFEDYPSSITNSDGTLRKSDKCQLRHALQELTSADGRNIDNRNVNIHGLV